MTIYLIMPELLENMLFLLEHFFCLVVGKLGENQRNEEEFFEKCGVLATLFRIAGRHQRVKLKR